LNSQGNGVTTLNGDFQSAVHTKPSSEDALQAEESFHQVICLWCFSTFWTNICPIILLDESMAAKDT